MIIIINFLLFSLYFSSKFLMHQEPAESKSAAPSEISLVLILLLLLFIYEFIYFILFIIYFKLIRESVGEVRALASFLYKVFLVVPF